MCTQISTSEFIPALIDCIAETKHKGCFVVPDVVLWQTVKELQKNCWTNVNLSYPAMEEVFSVLRCAFSEAGKGDFISRDTDGDIRVQRVDKECRKTMASYFFSTSAKWYQVLHSICEKCLSVTNDKVSFQNSYPVKSKAPDVYIQYLEVAYS